jgi:hypothetical protein
LHAIAGQAYMRGGDHLHMRNLKSAAADHKRSPGAGLQAAMQVMFR